MTIRDGSHDFDFLHGSWRIQNRKLRRRLAGASDWDEFPGTAVERPVWGGLANLEEYEADAPAGRVLGLALRLYDPVARQWSIHWSGSSYGTLDAPMVGDFRDGRGTFFGFEPHEGRQVLSRFVWTSAPPDACRWEQAWSIDGGATWETNWIMEFTRAT